MLTRSLISLMGMGPCGYCIPPCGFGFTLTVLAPLAKLRCRHQALETPHGSWSIPPRPPIPNRLRPGLSLMTGCIRSGRFLSSLLSPKKQYSDTGRQMGHRQVLNCSQSPGPSSSFSLPASTPVLELGNCLSGTPIQGAAPVLAWVKGISYTAAAALVILKPPATDNQDRRQVMKLDQAIQVYKEYHRMNSGKKHDRVLRRHPRQAL